ncbi:IclR family transcriptional regulator [Microbacterium gorillae]|uniref:IclR family transcriptional regulator n=1 Tax=Microbacterium gorillae TaxID=1231063 RepID=UPI000694E2D8|nr:helix-turn-helix domain-containing protein [Microbacterium gorillae]
MMQETASVDVDLANAKDSVLGKLDLILGVFAQGDRKVGLTELSRRSTVPKATAYRLASALTSMGFLRKSAEGYELGWRLFEMGQIVPGPTILREIARPHLVDLRESVHAAVVHLAVEHDGECVYLERIAGRQAAPHIGRVSMRVSDLSTASARLIAAYREGVMAPGAAAEIRLRRWASESGECVPGLRTVAVPVFAPGSTTHPIAAISAGIGVGRTDDERVLRALWGTAVDIGADLFRPRPSGRHLDLDDY